MAKGRVEKVEDVLSVGDEVRVRVLEVDEKGKVSLDRIDKPEVVAGAKPEREPRPGRRTRRPGDNGGDRKPRRRHESN
jgi:polyribonucleotide nucleotidyltransferase